MITKIDEIRVIVNRYSAIEASMHSLLEQTNLLELKKKQIELELAQNREAERALIDKIKHETGETPDFYKILQELNHELITVD
jgi:hypothetical protein